jgi:hypothetical protein
VVASPAASAPSGYSWQPSPHEYDDEAAARALQAVLDAEEEEVRDTGWTTVHANNKPKPVRPCWLELAPDRIS